MSKAGSEVILKCLLGREAEIDIDALPWGEEERVPAGVETVIAAEEIRPRRGAMIEVVEVKREGGGVRSVVVESEAGELDDRGGGEEIVVIKDEPVE